MNLIRNAIQTPDGTILRSRSRHDFSSHRDRKTGVTYSVDGGLDYVRRVGLNLGDVKDLSVYAEEVPHSAARDIAEWGTRGKNGKSRLRWITIAEMETDHIEAVLNEYNPAPGITFVMENELAYRSIFEITKKPSAGRLQETVDKLVEDTYSKEETDTVMVNRKEYERLKNLEAAVHKLPVKEWVEANGYGEPEPIGYIMQAREEWDDVMRLLEDF